jgi:hypothetical protein
MYAHDNYRLIHTAPAVWTIAKVNSYIINQKFRLSYILGLHYSTHIFFGGCYREYAVACHRPII